MNFNIKKHNLADILNIHFHVYDPLNEFVSKNEFLSIINSYKLLNGNFFPFPIFFNITNVEYKKIRNKKKLNLFYRSKLVCTLLIKSIYTIDKKKVGAKLFKTKDIKHNVVREILKHLKINNGMEIHYDGDLPARSGMGSSSTFVVGLMNTLFFLKNKKINKKILAKSSIHFEQNI